MYVHVSVNAYVYIANVFTIEIHTRGHVIGWYCFLLLKVSVFH